MFDVIKEAKEKNTDLYLNIQNNIDKSWEEVSDRYMTDAYGIDKTDEIEELEDIINERKNEAARINTDIGLDGSEVIEEYEFDTLSQIEGNKEKNKGSNTKIQGFQDNFKNEVLDINRLFNYTTNGSEEDWSIVPF